MRGKIDFLLGIATVLFGSAALVGLPTIVEYPLALMLIQLGSMMLTGVAILAVLVNCIEYVVNFEVYNR
jgi:hypothetical protein